MKKTAKENGAECAFPFQAIDYAPEFGLSKREFFAALAMQGMLADPKVSDIGNAAIHAVEAADALLAALADEGEKEADA